MDAMAWRLTREVLSTRTGLRALARHDPTLGEIARLRLLHGLELDEIAVSLEISVWTAKREWSSAKRWLRRYSLGQLSPEDLRLRAETEDVGRWNDQGETRH
jgi:DNA-directed RNA polymerase specialized sigma24 family protein